jgi:hypothetical protein
MMILNNHEVQTTKVYAGFDWYLDCKEDEKVWKGIVQRRLAPIGPNTRTANKYVLLTEDAEFPIYAANVEGKIGEYVGRNVVICGKLVDLSIEGFGKELWIGTIRIAKEGNDFVDIT